MQFKGYVEKKIFSNDENGHAIIEVSLSSDEIKRLRDENPDDAQEITDEMTCVGTLSMVDPGEFIVFNGDFTVHPTYGLQFRVTSFEESRPDDLDSLERYLGSGAIKGLGPTLASRIVRHFGEDTFRVIDETPEELSKIKGISDRMAMEIADQLALKRGMRKIMIALEKLGLTMNLAAKAYKKYGENVCDIIEENPYKLADEIDGIGFKKADEIAFSAGISKDSPYRIKSGILYALRQAMGSGHTYVPKDMLSEQVSDMLEVDIDGNDALTDLIMEGKITIRDAAGTEAVYLTSVYKTELNIARRLTELDVKYKTDKKKLAEDIRHIEESENIKLEDMQADAVAGAAENGLLIITGGPGTGKTTTINSIIRYFQNEGLELFLAAPTGRAAKRMTETTGCEARTIHRLLEVNGGVESDDSVQFGKNEDDPLDADVIIIDEMSMVDIFLMNNLLRAVADGTRLILVGDADQLPSVGPGNVLKDIIEAGKFCVVKLTRIFRQSENSDIVVNAHKINEGKVFDIGPSSRDFPFISRPDADSIISAVITLVKEKLPAYTGAQVNDIQVLTPTRKGNLGVDRLNSILQCYLNPKSSGKTEKEIGNKIFREGDKVMQIRNNYQMPWEVRGVNGIAIETGTGIFNGDMGIIENINLIMSEMTVLFDDEKYVKYSFKDVSDLEHAYAVTVHKSQGSEYPAVVLPLLSGPRMLMNRNILYTAVTRAKKCICIVGSKNTFCSMIENVNEQKRYSALAQRIREIGENASEN